METSLWRRIAALLPFLFVLTLLAGCKRPVATFYVLEGNYRYDQGRYQEAVASYFKALSRAEPNEEGAIRYNLGAAYGALGEDAPALTMWDASIALAGDRSGYKSKALYNKGVIYYRLGQYDDSIDALKRTLDIDESNLDAKVNLELAVAKRREVMKAEPTPTRPTSNAKSDDRVGRTLDYLSRREAFFTGTDRRGDESWRKDAEDR